MNKERRKGLMIEELLEEEKYLETEKRNINSAIDHLRTRSQDPYNDLALRDARNQTKVIRRMLDTLGKSVGRIQNLKYQLDKL